MENQTPTPAPSDIPQPLNPVIVPEKFDQELNDHLDKAFNRSIPKQDEPKVEEPKRVEAKEQIEEKQEAKVEVKKSDKPLEVEKPLLTPDEVDKMEPKKQDAWTALKNNNKRSLRALEQKESEIAKLKAVVAERGQMSQKELDALKAEIGELSKYRAMIDIQADPEFITKYDKPIENITKGIKTMLKAMVVGTQTTPEQVDQIDVSNSEIMDQITSSVKDKFSARKMERMVEELLKLKDERNETLSEQKEKYKETLEIRKKQAFEKDTESEGRALRYLEKIASGKDHEGKQKSDPVPFLNKVTPTETASQLEIDQINSHNRMVEMMQQKVQQAFGAKSPEERMDVAVTATAAIFLSSKLRMADSRIKSLEDELKKISAVNTESEKSKPASIRRNGNGSILSHEEALSAHFGRS